MTLTELYMQSSERAESYRNILQELVNQCAGIALENGEDWRIGQGCEMMDVLGVAQEMLGDDHYDRQIVDMPPESYSVSVPKVCNPECVNIGTSHDECIGESGVWLPKILPNAPGEMLCTIHREDYE